jgi:ribulose-phosphate 3-epimerase
MDISASLLACDPLYLGDMIKLTEETGDIHSFHVDIMDGHYVENLTFGPGTVSAMRKITKLPIHVHLEVSNPERQMQLFADAGADSIIVQMDTCTHPIRVLEMINKNNIASSIALNPHVLVEMAEHLKGYFNWLLIMSVEPGFGGQCFNECTYVKIQQARKIFGDDIILGIDGGVNPNNIGKLAEAGISRFIIGTSLYKNNDIRSNIQLLRQSASAKI